MKTRWLILAGLFGMVLILASAGSAPLAAQSTPEPQPGQVDRAGALALTWKRSTMWTGDYNGPADGNGRYWHHRQYDDSAWLVAAMPNNGSDSGLSDYYYRAHFTWDGTSPVVVRFAGDDGLQVYVNGNKLGEWGSGWRFPGCFNVPSCLINYTVPDQVVPTYMLQTGDNVIAIDLWNSLAGTFSLDVGVTVQPPVVTISHVEFMQVTQDAAGSVPMIAGKSTVVRVYVNCDTGCLSAPDVGGRLEVSSPTGGQSLEPSPQKITAYSMTNWTYQRPYWDHTLNFIVPPNLVGGNVVITAVVGNSTYHGGFNTEPAQVLRMAYVPVRYTPPLLSFCPGKGEPSDRIASAFALAQKLYPTARIDLVRLPPMPFSEPVCPPWYNDERQNKLFNALLDWNNNTNNQSMRVFGWLPDAAYNGGVAQVYPDDTGKYIGGQVAFGDDDPVFGQGIFAHETAHLLGRPHTKIAGAAKDCQSPSPKDWSDWPFSTARLDALGVDVERQILKDPQTTYDLMSYCWYMYRWSGWSSLWNYTHIYSESLRIGAQASVQRTETVQPYLVVSGLVYTDDVVAINPIWTISTITPGQNPAPGTAYCLESQDATNAILSSRCFDLRFTNQGTGEASYTDGVNVWLPYLSGAKRIVLKKGSQELFVRQVSPNTPEVTVSSPGNGTHWSATGTYTVSWTATDADSDALVFNVLYSPGGDHWVPVGTLITETQLAVSAIDLAGGDAAKIRVVATDGMNTSYADSAGTLIVEKRIPQPGILSPQTTDRIAPNTPILLEGYAYDPEDGTLSDSALYWISNVDGQLGTGGTVLATLTQGLHTLTLSAVDSDGNTSTASINVYVGFRVFLPAVRR